MRFRYFEKINGQPENFDKRKENSVSSKVDMIMRLQKNIVLSGNKGLINNCKGKSD